MTGRAGIIFWYDEPEQSAKDEEIAARPQFAALFAATGTEFVGVLAHDTSGWSRNVAVTRNSLAYLHRRGVWWQLAEEQFTIDNIQEPGLGIGFGLAAQQAEDYTRPTLQAHHCRTRGPGTRRVSPGPSTFRLCAARLFAASTPCSVDLASATCGSQT